MGSSRFPGKPLAPICGRPMIEHVWRRACLCPKLDIVAVATCDREIYDLIRSRGGLAIMTSDSHERCTDRTREAADGLRADIVVNLQGDEPFVTPAMIEAALNPLLSDSSLVCTNLMARITDRETFEDPNEVKVVFDQQMNALYMSREPIPSLKKGGAFDHAWKQVCVIPFRSDFLKVFSELPPTPLEVRESVDMMRAIEHGFKVRMVPCEAPGISVDTEEDRREAERLMADDPLFRQLYP